MVGHLYPWVRAGNEIATALHRGRAEPALERAEPYESCVSVSQTNEGAQWSACSFSPAESGMALSGHGCGFWKLSGRVWPPWINNPNKEARCAVPPWLWEQSDPAVLPFCRGQRKLRCGRLPTFSRCGYGSSRGSFVVWIQICLDGFCPKFFFPFSLVSPLVSRRLVWCQSFLNT
jgi:hypothetical protein